MLPDGDIEWPPRPLKAEIDRVDTLAAWYAGDVDKLRPHSHGGTRESRRWLRLPSGTRTTEPAGTRDTFPVHVPVAADIARTSADLLFSELPVITVTGLDGEVNEAAAGRVRELVDELDLEARLLEAAELCAALSGVYWRVTFDLLGAPDTPRLSWVQPDNVLPEWSWGELVAATIVRRLPDPSGEERVWRHLERHSVQSVGGRPTAVIEHGLYVGSDEGKLGTRVPLDSHPDVSDIVESLTSEDRIEMSGVPVLTCGYVPNLRPNRADRGSPLGRPDVDQLDDALRAVDITWTSWLRDLRLGRARIIVPSEYLRPANPGDGAMFDEAREVYSPLSMMPPTDGSHSGITISQFAVRTEEHSATLLALMQQIVSSAGYSMRTFGLAGAGGGGDAATATQVDSEDSLSATTRAKKIRYWRPELRRLVAALLSVDAMILRNGEGLPYSPRQVNVEFPPAVAPRAEVTASTASLLAQARAASTDTLVRMVHPDWSDAQVSEEVRRIAGEQGTPAADPTLLGAGGSGLSLEG